MWTALGRSSSTRGVPRSVLGRHLGVQKPSRTHPEASPKRFWTPRTAQDRFFVDFGTIWRGFPTISNQFFVDFRSNRLRRSHRIGSSKKSRVILAARLGTCGVQSLRAARAFFKWFLNNTCSAFFRCVPTSPPSFKLMNKYLDKSD